MNLSYNRLYPSVKDLEKRAHKRIPKFAFDYLFGGCNDDCNLSINRTDLQSIQLKPHYLKEEFVPNMSCKLFGLQYDAPFGISPVGLQGMIWPNSPEILAKASFQHKIPYVLSTVSTSSIEKIAELSQGTAWFQLYYPIEKKIREDIINRVSSAQLPVLVLIADVPTFGHRPRDIKNGLSMPPKISFKNFLQATTKPAWSIGTLKYGIPKFATLEPYMSKNLNLKQVGEFMDTTFTGRLDKEKIQKIRDTWKGILILKGMASEEDTQTAIDVGVDGIIVSNHGGRQIDLGESSISSLKRLVSKFQGKITIMMDSGLRNGVDMARAFSLGADFVFMGRTFMYGVGALGEKGGNHTISLLKTELNQIMQQIGCEKISDFPRFLIK